MIQFLHLSSRGNKFLVSLFLSIQFFFPWVAGCHLIIGDVFHKTISRLFFSLLVFQQLRSTLLLRMPSQTLLWQKLAFSSPFFYFNDLSSIIFFRRLCDVALFSPSFRFVRIVFFSRFIHLTGVLCPLLKSFSSYQVLHNFFFNRSASRSCSPLLLFPTGVLSTLSSSLHYSFLFVQPLKVLWFHSFVKGAT